MTEKEGIKASKFLSLMLRHEPERFGLKLGDAGWVRVDEFAPARCIAPVMGFGVPLTVSGS